MILAFLIDDIDASVSVVVELALDSEPIIIIIVSINFFKRSCMLASVVSKYNASRRYHGIGNFCFSYL